MQAPVIVWFRQDLRLGDNPALHAAARGGRPVVPVFVLDDDSAGEWQPGGASRWWLHHSLESLSASLDGRLACFRGSGDTIIPALARAVGASAIHVNRSVEPWQVACDARVEAALAADGIGLERFLGSTLFDPAVVRKADGTPYKVFTPFYRRGCLQGASPPRAPLPEPPALEARMAPDALGIDELGLLPTVDWASGFAREWQVGESAAAVRLDHFLDSGIRGYRDGRNRPDLRKVSRLSPHLHFGEISPNQVWHAVLPLLADRTLEADVDCFMSELGWREFSQYLLWHWPSLPEVNLQAKFDRFPWMPDHSVLERWQRGSTGIPIVDAGMRELWETGYMHNRVRMIVGSFLVKNLLQNWREGERWFWDTLCDADLANNSASWQWVAGSGADAAPYFRIFNPVTQGEKFDPEGRYVRRFVPELEHLPNDTIHKPWAAPSAVMRGIDYPPPVVDLKASRERALAAFRSLA